MEPLLNALLSYHFIFKQKFKRKKRQIIVHTHFEPFSICFMSCATFVGCSIGHNEGIESENGRKSKGVLFHSLFAFWINWAVRCTESTLLVSLSVSFSTPCTKNAYAGRFKEFPHSFIIQFNFEGFFPWRTRFRYSYFFCFAPLLSLYISGKCTVWGLWVCFKINW